MLQKPRMDSELNCEKLTGQLMGSLMEDWQVSIHSEAKHDLQEPRDSVAECWGRNISIQDRP